MMELVMIRPRTPVLINLPLAQLKDTRAANIAAFLIVADSIASAAAVCIRVGATQTGAVPIIRRTRVPASDDPRNKSMGTLNPQPHCRTG